MQNISTRSALTLPRKTFCQRHRLQHRLFTVFWYSSSGVESFTHPPPACTRAWPFLISAVRMVMQQSRLPLKLKKPTQPACGPRPALRDAFEFGNELHGANLRRASGRIRSCEAKDFVGLLLPRGRTNAPAVPQRYYRLRWP